MLNRLLRRFTEKPKPAETGRDHLPANIIFPAYSRAIPSLQATLDIFKSHWKSRLPGRFGLTAGTLPMFADRRVHRTSKIIPGGIKGKTVLELGPFEAYNTYHLQKLGASEIVSIEGNNINFLKCLVLKQALRLKATFLHGDFCAYLRNTDRRFDIIWASGVLYHQEDPLELLALIAAHTDTAFFWTHYYDERVLTNANRDSFVQEKNVQKRWGDFSCTHYHRSYDLPSDQDIPLYFEGGNALSAYWLTLEDIFEFLRRVGMAKITTRHLGQMNGLPVASFLAEKA